MAGPWISGHTHDSNVWIQLYQFRPSENWARGGQIVEEYIDRLVRVDAHSWSAHMMSYSKPEAYCNGHGETALLAAMRCFVAAKLGDTVEIPDNLFALLD